VSEKAAKRKAGAKKAAATRARNKAKADAIAAVVVAKAEAVAALDAKRRPGLVLAIDQVDSKVSNKMRTRASTSTAATHIDARGDASKVMSKAVKAKRGAKSTANQRKKAFHARWLSGLNGETMEEKEWAREFINS
jgi:hypothetical protein